MKMSEGTGLAVIQNAWPTVCSFEWMLEAHRHACKGKRYRLEVMGFTSKLEKNLLDVQERMKDGSYELGPYRKMWVFVPKKRLVMALDYPDRIVQWCLYLYLNPIYDKLFIEDSYACRKGKGSHKAAKRLQYWMQQVSRKPGPGWYCLKLDISKYFYRVNHDKLLEILSRRIADQEMMEFVRGVVNSKAEPFGLPRWRSPDDTPPEEWEYETGMPIGNLTSQLFANIYLNELDQYCKHKLKIHYYIRYMDDVIILGPNKWVLHEWKEEIEEFLEKELHLDLNAKTSIRPMKSGIEFVGVRIWPTHMKLRKSTVRRIKRETRKISSLYASGDMPEITSVIVNAIITICGLVFTGVCIPWLVKTGIPWLKEKHLYTIITTFVKAAEKMADAGSLTMPKLDYVIKMLESKGITITPEVRAMIEAAVQDLDIAIDGAIGQLGDIFVEEAKSKTE